MRALICLLIGLIQINPVIEKFILDYRASYENKLSLYNNPQLKYVPEIQNLCDQHSWDKLSSSQRRDSLFTYLLNPSLYDDFALDLLRREYYIFPMGTMENVPEDQKHIITGPVQYKNWYYYEVLCPLIDYLNDHDVEFVFSIANLLDYGTLNGRWWTIEGNSLLILLYDKDNNKYYSVDAQKFISEMAPKEYFGVFFTKRCIEK